MSRSPTDCRVLIPPTRAGGRSSAPPPEPRGAEGLPAPGAETTALPTEAEPRPAGTRTHPTLPPASSPPPDTAGTHLVYRPDSCSGRGRGTRATPRRAEPPPAVTRWLPRLAEQGASLKTERRDPPVLARLIGERDTGPLSRPSSSLPLPGLGRSPLSPQEKANPIPHHTPENSSSPPRGTQEIRLRRAPPGAGSPAREAWPLPSLPGGSLRAGLESRGPSPRPSPPVRVGEGWVPPPQRGARRLRRGRGRGGPRGGGGLTCATAMPPAAESLSSAEARSGTARGKGLWDRGDDRNGSRPGVPRPPQRAGDRAGPQGSRLWAPLPPPGTEIGNGTLSRPRRRSGSK